MAGAEQAARQHGYVTAQRCHRFIAGLSYVFDSLSAVLIPDFGTTIGQFTFVGEVLLALWLVVNGASARQWATSTVQSS